MRLRMRLAASNRLLPHWLNDAMGSGDIEAKPLNLRKLDLAAARR
jgi:hypothetical protein